MTYGDEQIGLEIRNTLRGFPDEFMDFIVGGLQVRRSLCHLPRKSAGSTIGVRDKSCKALSAPLPFTCFISRRVDHQSSVRISKSI